MSPMHLEQARLKSGSLRPLIRVFSGRQREENQNKTQRQVEDKQIKYKEVKTKSKTELLGSISVHHNWSKQCLIPKNNKGKTKSTP